MPAPKASGWTPKQQSSTVLLLDHLPLQQLSFAEIPAQTHGLEAPEGACP
jgi:hypothetical protein